jgi:3'-phosphoadenosine 5'-phosphosulfate sulfotransferase (PAPS reductase)/FAD synthetase
MIICNKKTEIADPAEVVGTAVLSLVHHAIENRNIEFKIPKHIVLNKEKKEYKAGFLNELYLILYPDRLKKDIFEDVTNRYDLFVDERQYQNLVHEYGIKKYHTFIK